MAEHIIGLLFVAQTSRDRHVFRYPPDPTSMTDRRLSMPVYSKSTYTAHDNTVDRNGHHVRLMSRRSGGSRGSGTRAGQSGFSTGAVSGGTGGSASEARTRSRRDGTTAASGSRSGGGLYTGAGGVGSEVDSISFGRSATGSIHSHITEYGSGGDSTSSSSDDSDIDGLWDSVNHGWSHATRRWSNETSDVGRGGNVHGTPGTVHSSLPKPLTEVLSNAAGADGRRGSASESEGTAKGTARARKHHTSASLDLQYNYSMGYSIDFLGDLLLPPRRACNHKFEISVNEHVFLGHPVCAGPEGKWSYPADDSDSDDGGAGDGGREGRRHVSRGRRMDVGGRDVALRSVAEHPEGLPHHNSVATESPANANTSTTASTLVSSTEVSSVAATPATRSRSNTVTGTGTVSSVAPPTAAALSASIIKAKDEPELTMFHLVLVIDKPDPTLDDTDTSDLLDGVYREIAFKWTAAAFALQVRENWVATQVKEITRIREKAMADGVSVTECLRVCIERSELARSLHELYATLHQIKSRPLNGHFSHISTTFKVNVGSIPITIVCPPRTRKPVPAGLDAESDDSDSDDEWEGAAPDGALLAKQPGFRVEPWKTLLILEDDEDRARVRQRTAPRRLGRRESTQVEEEELVDQLIQACDVTRTLAEIAHNLRCDLEGVVIPLARELVQNKRAVFIDPINVRLRTILIPATIIDHVRSITQHAVRFSVMFPKLPPLIVVIAMISAAPVPFRDLLPVDAQADPAKREPYIRAVAWLLRNDLVEQAHVHARVVANPAVKEAAWRKLWHRRRRRWLRERKASVTSGGGRSTSSRPSFGESSAPGASPTTAAAVKAASPSSDRDASGSAGTTTGAGGGLPGWPQLAARVPRTPLVVTRTLSVGETVDDDESDFEIDSDADDLGMDMEGNDDVDEGYGNARLRSLRPPGGPGIEAGQYSVDEDEPRHVPTFTASFIFHPARAHKHEARWLRIVRERTPDPVLRSRFDLCVQYFDGVTTFEEIVFRTGLSRRELDRIAHVYRDDIKPYTL